MKTLILMRHAKSSWKDSKVDDHERPLSKRGEKDAPAMAGLILEKELIPQKILCSTSKRTRQTVDIIAKVCSYHGDVVYLKTLYMAEAEVIVEVLNNLPDSMERVLVMGHNPGLETLLQGLTRQVVPFPTASVAHLVLPVKSWSDLKIDTEAELAECWRPRDVKEKQKK